MKDHFQGTLKAILLTALAWEFIARPVIMTIWPERGMPESAAGDVVRLILGIFGGGM